MKEEEKEEELESEEEEQNGKDSRGAEEDKEKVKEKKEEGSCFDLGARWTNSANQGCPPHDLQQPFPLSLCPATSAMFLLPVYFHGAPQGRQGVAGATALSLSHGWCWCDAIYPLC